MIIKVIEHKQEQSERDAEALVRYVKGERGMDADVEKIASGYGGQVNFDEADGTDQQLLLLRELMRETRSRRPLMHTVIAWAEGERPTPEQVDEAVTIWLKQLKLTGVPALWAVHENTAFMHCHVVVCLVDPMTSTWRDPTFYKRDSQRAKAKIEKLQGWAPCANDLYMPNPDGLGIAPNPAREKEPNKPELPPLKQGAADMEHRTGKMSRISIAQKTVPPILEEAKGWQDFHRKLAEAGISYHPAPRGGFQFTVDGENISATSVMRKCSKQIEKKLGGPYEAPAQDVPAPAPPPAAPVPAAGMDEDMVPFWLRYQMETAAWQEESRRQEEAVREEQKRQSAAVIEENRRIRRQVKADIRQADRLVRKARRKGGRLPAGTDEALRLAIEERGRKALQPLPARKRTGRPAFPAFADWLEASGEQELADRWRQRLRTRREDEQMRRTLDDVAWQITHTHWAAPG